MDVLKGIHLQVGNGVGLDTDGVVNWHLNVSGGVALQYARVDHNSFQALVNGNVSYWGNGIWQYGGETGLRLSVGDWENRYAWIMNIDLLATVGAMVGGDETGVAVEPTLKTGFLWDTFGLEASAVAYSDNSNIDPGTLYIGVYVNPLSILGLALL